MKHASLVLALAACAGSKPAPAPPQPVPLAISNTAAPQEDPPPAGDDDVLVKKRWVFAAYFTKLKHKVRDNWEPAAVWKALPAVTRGSLGTAQRDTTVEAVLAADGTLVKLAIVKSSGVAELDAEAIRAFQVSSPFETVPIEIQPLRPFKFSFFFDVAGTSVVR
ncbi:MAG: TonB C-terminal domain-containing protein [Kofleriaceae bacterium]|nr:TonB C-terminal domain-containing protein [Kofleriaceae bacterium]